MAQELTQKQLETMVNGVPQNPVATFFDKAVLNVEASKEEGRRIYRKVVFIKVKQPGVTDWVAYIAQPADMKQYAQEYEYFLKNRQGKRIPGLEIIPGLDVSQLQELYDMGLHTISQLAATVAVPPHLESARLSAVAINSVLQEQSNGKEESNPQTHIEPVLTPDRPINPVSLERPAVPTSGSIGDGKVAEGIREGGRFNDNQGIGNFNYEFIVRN